MILVWLVFACLTACVVLFYVLELGLPRLRLGARPVPAATKGFEVRDTNALIMACLENPDRARLLEAGPDMWRVAAGSRCRRFDVEFAVRRLSQLNPQQNTWVTESKNADKVVICLVDLFPPPGSGRVVSAREIPRKGQTIKALAREFAEFARVPDVDPDRAGLYRDCRIRQTGYQELEVVDGRAILWEVYLHTFLGCSGCDCPLGLLWTLLEFAALWGGAAMTTWHPPMLAALISLPQLLANLWCWGPHMLNALDIEDVLRDMYLRYALAPMLLYLQLPFWTIWIEVATLSFCLTTVKRGCRLNLPLSPTAGAPCSGSPCSGSSGSAWEAMVVNATRCARCSWANLMQLIRSCTVLFATAVCLCELISLSEPTTEFSLIN